MSLRSISQSFGPTSDSAWAGSMVCSSLDLHHLPAAEWKTRDILAQFSVHLVFADRPTRGRSQCQIDRPAVTSSAGTHLYGAQGVSHYLIKHVRTADAITFRARTDLRSVILDVRSGSAGACKSTWSRMSASMRLSCKRRKV